MDYSKLQDFLNQSYPDNFNGDPEGLAIRILKMYRGRFTEKYEKLEGLPKEQMIICQLINVLQDKRLASIDQAIETLELGQAAETVHEAILKQGW